MMTNMIMDGLRVTYETLDIKTHSKRYKNLLAEEKYVRKFKRSM